MTYTKENQDEFPKFTITSPGRTKMGRLRDLFDEIGVAKAAGWRHDRILQGLHEQSLDMTPQAFADALMKIRRERKTAGRENEGAVRSVGQTPEKTPAISTRLDGGSGTKSGSKFSPGGYRNPLETFTRDVTKRTNLDE